MRLKLSRSFLLCFLACLAATVVFGKSRPNILLILADDAGYHDFGFMGSEDLPTPRLDQLAEAGTIFTDAHVTATVCSPSRAGLLTGRYQQRFGHECNVPPDDTGMDPSEQTLGDVLRTANYRTCMIGKWHVGNRSSYHPNNRGFDEFYGFLEGARSYFPDPKVDQPENFRALLHNRKQVAFDGYLTDVLTDKALEIIKQDADQPFFMFLSYNAVHTPMHAKEAHLEKFAGHPRQKLAAMTWSLDENVGRVVDALEAQGQLENTLLFFLSDNGGAGKNNNQSSNYPLKGWKGNKYEGGHRVPFFVTWKGTIPGGQRFEGLTSALDIFATSLAAAGLEDTTGKSLDGTNLLPYLHGQKTGDPHDQLFWRKDRMAAVRQGPYKLVRLEGYGYRLYNLDDDLAESKDLCHSQPGRFQSMQSALIAWERELAVPLWYEDEGWNQVTYEIHRALMDNRAPHYITPGQYQTYQKSNDN